MKRTLLRLAVLAVSAITGFYLALPSDSSSDLYFAKTPEDPATLTLTENLFADTSPFIESTSKLQRVSERDGETEAVSTKFYCPNEALEWGELIVRWEWQSDWIPRLGILDPNVAIITAFDPATQAELYVASEATGGEWVQLCRLEKKLDRTELQRAIDVTPWVQKGNYLRVKYRLMAEKFMTHPTPDDPIGFAGAQCLRQLRVKPHATRLRLWK
jgi:hypothetical protein